MTTYKASDVQMLQLEFPPTAVCNGIEPTEEGGQRVMCHWSYGPANFPFVGAETKKKAKSHAQHFPGHVVVVERVTKSTYWVDVPVPQKQEETNG